MVKAIRVLSVGREVVNLFNVFEILLWFSYNKAHYAQEVPIHAPTLQTFFSFQLMISIEGLD